MSNEVKQCHAIASCSTLVQTLHKKGERQQGEGTWSCDTACLAQGFWF